MALRSRVRPHWRGVLSDGGAFPLDTSSVDMSFSTGRYFGAVLSDLTVTRASTAYATDLSGALFSFGSNVARVTNRGLLIEESRTNVVLQSQDFDNATWANTAVTVTANQTTAPDGTLTADLLANTTANSQHILNSVGTTSYTSGTVYTFSTYAKAGPGNQYVQLTPSSAAFTGLPYANFDLVNGTVTATGGTNSPVSSIAAAGNGWYRCVLTATAAVTTSGPTINIGQITLNGSGLDSRLPSFTGTTVGPYIWGAQSEVGSFVTSYTPTTAGTVTRAADVVVCGSPISTVVAAATGTIVAQTNFAVAGITADIFDSNAAIHLGFTSGNVATTQITSTTSTATTSTRTGRDKMAVAWSAGGRAICLNAGTVVTDAVAVTPSATERLGSTGAASFLNGYIERLTLYTSKQSNGNLQTLTT